MTTALTPVINGNGHKELAEYNPDSFDIPGMENVSPSELRIPVLKIVQMTSKFDNADVHRGYWHNSVTGEDIANPEVLIIGVAKGRVMFPKPYNSENKPSCGSDNDKSPRPEYVGTILKTVITDELGDPKVISNAIPPACEGCPFAQWGEGGEPPACSEVNTFAYVGKDGLPGIWQAQRTAMKAAAALKTLAAANSIRKTVRFSTIKETTDSGVFYTPVFTPGTKPDKDWQLTAFKLATLGNLAERNQQAAAEMDYRSEGNGHGAPTGPVEGEEPGPGELDDALPF
jgi:hypothetical protein